jgi:ABC-type polar amino acid transport system ATPase subunit
MIVVTHEMEFARSVADVVIYMAGGVIEEIDAGNSADLDNGQADKQYRIIFTDRTISSL